MIPAKQIYPRSGDNHTVYLNQVITNPNIIIGDYTMYHDFRKDPTLFEQNNVLYHYPINHDKLIIGKFCSIACGTRFLFNSANHSLTSLSTYPFPLFFEEWKQNPCDVTMSWNNKGDIVSYKEKLYKSLIDGNTWSPDEYPQGWEEYEE